MQADFLEEGEGPPVILVHSSVSGARQWRRLMRDLKPYFRGRAVNLFGYGATPAWPDRRRQTLDDQATLVEQLVPADAHDIAIVGHSFGGSVAMRTAMRLGSRVTRLVLFEPNPFPLLRQHGRAAAFAEISDLRDWIKQQGAAGEWVAAAARFADYWGGAGAWADMNEERRAAFVEALRPNYFEWDAVMAEPSPLNGWEAALPSRTLVLRSEETMRPMREIADLMHERCPHWSFATVAQGGHMAPLTRPDLVNPLIISFLRGDPG